MEYLKKLQKAVDFLKKHLPKDIGSCQYNRTYININLIAVGLIFLFIGLLPLYPKLFFSGSKNNLTLLDFSTTTLPANADWDKNYKNRIIIPSIGVDMSIITDETNEQRAFAKGAWLLPGTAIPNTEKGNTVIAAHRYMFTSGANTFYNLDKVKIGNKIIIRYENQDFVYNVVETKIVTPKNVEILTQTDQPILTIFTCHPIYSSRQRLVVVAKLIQ